MQNRQKIFIDWYNCFKFVNCNNDYWKKKEMIKYCFEQFFDGCYNCTLVQSYNYGMERLQMKLGLPVANKKEL